MNMFRLFLGPPQTLRLAFTTTETPYIAYFKPRFFFVYFPTYEISGFSILIAGVAGYFLYPSRPVSYPGGPRRNRESRRGRWERRTTKLESEWKFTHAQVWYRLLL